MQLQRRSQLKVNDFICTLVLKMILFFSRLCGFNFINLSILTEKILVFRMVDARTPKSKATKSGVSHQQGEFCYRNGSGGSAS